MASSRARAANSAASLARTMKLDDIDRQALDFLSGGPDTPGVVDCDEILGAQFVFLALVKRGLAPATQATRSLPTRSQLPGSPRWPPRPSIRNAVSVGYSIGYPKPLSYALGARAVFARHAGGDAALNDWGSGLAAIGSAVALIGRRSPCSQCGC